MDCKLGPVGDDVRDQFQKFLLARDFSIEKNRLGRQKCGNCHAWGYECGLAENDARILLKLQDYASPMDLVSDKKKGESSSPG